MRKTSQDGGDSTSITSGVDNENKKSVFKLKKSSLKRKSPNISHESDDTVIEPLLQKDKEKPEIIQGANIFIKTKTGFANGKDSDKVKLLNDKVETSATTGFCGTTESLLSTKDYEVSETTPKVTAPIHNHMHTNVFNSHDNSKSNVTAKSQILVEIDASNQSGYNPSPLIFTTAKIHTNGKSKNMEPVQVTPVPILSTIEVSVSKSGNITSNEKKIITGSSVLTAVNSPVPGDKVKEEKVSVTNCNEVMIKDIVGKPFPTTIDSKISNNTSTPNSSFKNHIPSSMSKTSLTSKVIDKPFIANDIKKEESLQKLSEPQLKSNVDTTKNCVSVKTTKMLPGQFNMVEILSKQSKHVQTGKLEPNSGNKTESKQEKSKSSEQSASNIKSPITSKEPVGITSELSKNVSSSSGSKQLQRQMTAAKDTSAFESKEFVPDVQTSKDFSAKTEVSSKTKVSDSNLSKNSEIVPRVSANNIQTLTKSCSNTTATSTNCEISTSTTKPVITTISLSITVTSTAASVTSKPAVTTSLKATTISPLSTTSSSEASISATTILPVTSKSTASTTPILVSTMKFPEVNSAQTKATTKQSTTSTANNLSKTPSVTTSMKISSIGSAVTTITSTKPSSEVTSAQTMSTKQPSTSIGQTIPSKPSHTTSAQKKTMNSISKTDVSLSAKPATSVQMTAAATKPITSVSKTDVAKIPTVTSTKTSQIDFDSSANLTKPPSEISSAKQTKTSIGKPVLSKLPSVTTSINTTPIDSVSSPSTKPLSEVSSTKQPITSIGETVHSELPLVTTSSKTTPIGYVSSTSTKISSGVSSSKTSTSVARPSSVVTSTNTSANVTVASSTSDKPCTEISSAHMTTTKQPTSSIGKKTAAKTAPVITPIKLTPLNITSSTSASKTKPTGVTCAETTASSNTPTTAVGSNVLEKTPSVKRSTKTSVSSVNSESKSTSIAISSSKPVATAGSVPSSTSAFGPPSNVSETKQGQSKSNQYNKDVKISKA